MSEFEAIPDEIVDRLSCKYCSRKFVPESLIKHEPVCWKTLHKKRKIFDSAKQRIQGTELAEYLPLTTFKRHDTLPSFPAKHSSVSFKQILNVPSRKHSKITSPSDTSLSTYKQCSYCDRSFGPKAFDRHIEWCKEQSTRINLKSNATKEAKERLEARIKYRAPSFKSKRSITREKYSSKTSLEDHHNDSSTLNENCTDFSTKFDESCNREVKLRGPDQPKPKSKHKETNFIRQNVLRCSYKTRLSKKVDSKAEKEKINSSFHNSDFCEVQDWITASGTKIQPSPSLSQISSTSSIFSSSMHDDYDPFSKAEDQMKELFNNNSINETYSVSKRTYNTPSNAVKEERRNFKCQNKENECDELTKTKSAQTEADDNSQIRFKTSPTSAFIKYPSRENLEQKFVRVPTPVPSSETEKDHYFLPPIVNNGKRSASGDTMQESNVNRYPLVSLSNLSLCSSTNANVPDESRKQTTCKNAAEMCNDAHMPVVKRSISATNEKSNRNALKKNLKMENLLYGNEDPRNTRSSKYERKLDRLNDLLDDESLNLMQSFADFENVLQNSYSDNETFNVMRASSEDNAKAFLERSDSIASKMSVDSAYNSLYRKSPLPFELHNFAGKTSTPESDSFKSSFTVTSDSSNGNASKLSKFCHECGAKFPLAIAKFCCECGVRRLVI